MIRILRRLIELLLGYKGRTANSATPRDLARLTASLRQSCDDLDAALVSAEDADWRLRESARVLAAAGVCRQTVESLVGAARSVDKRAVAMDRMAAQLADATPEDFGGAR